MGEKDIIIEIDKVSNRPDISNLIGFTREICNLMKFSLIKNPTFLRKLN